MREEAKELKKTSVPGKEGRYDSYLHNTLAQDIVHLAKANNAQLDALTGSDVDADGNFVGLGDPTHMTKSVDAFVKQGLYNDYGAVNALVLKRKIRDIEPLNEVTAGRAYEQILNGMMFHFIPFAKNTSSTVTLQLNDHKDLVNNVHPVFNAHGEDLPVGYLNPPNVYMAIFDKTLGSSGGYKIHLVTSIPGGGGGGVGSGRQVLFTHDSVLVENRIVDGKSYTYINLKSNVDAGYSEYPNYYDGLSVHFEMHQHGLLFPYIELDGGGNPDKPTKAILFSKNHEHLTQKDVNKWFLSPKQSFMEGQWYIAVYVPAKKDVDGAETVEHYWKVHVSTPGDHSLYAENPGNYTINNAINEEIAPALPLYLTQREMNRNRNSAHYPTDTGSGIKILDQWVMPLQTSNQYYDSRDDEMKYKLDTRAGSVFGEGATKYFNGRDGGRLFQETGCLRLFVDTSAANGLTPSPGCKQVIRVDSNTRAWIRGDVSVNITRLYFYIPYKVKIPNQRAVKIFNANVENIGKQSWNKNNEWLTSYLVRPDLTGIDATSFPLFIMYKDYDFFHPTKQGVTNPEDYTQHPAEIDLDRALRLNNISQAQKVVFDQWINDYYEGKGFIGCFVKFFELFKSSSYVVRTYSEQYAYDKETNAVVKTDSMEINYNVTYVSPW